MTAQARTSILLVLLVSLVGGAFWASQGRDVAVPAASVPTPNRAAEERNAGARFGQLQPPPTERVGVGDTSARSEPDVDARTALPAPVRSATSEKERWFVEHLNDFLDHADVARLLQGQELMLSDADWDALIELQTTLQEKVNQVSIEQCTLGNQVMTERMARGEGELLTEQNRHELLRPAYAGETVLQQAGEGRYIVIRVPPGVDRRLDEPRRRVENLTELKKRSLSEFLESRLTKGR